MNRLLRLRDVQMMTGLGSSTIYRHISAGTFPRQVRIGGHAARWLESEISDWIKNLAAQRYPNDQRSGSRTMA